MAAVVALLLVAAIVVAAATHRDMFSPAKFFLASYALFHAGAWTAPRPLELWLLMLLVLAVGIATVAVEAGDDPGSRPGPRAPLPSGGFAIWLWLFTLPALGAQWAIIDMFGGLAGYINALGNRVLEFRGLGWVRTLTSMLLVVNLAYFAVGLVEQRRRLWWCGYAMHLLLLIGIGLLSGSRSGVLNVFAMQLFLYHYLRRRVSAGRALALAAALVVGAGVLGIAREGLKVDDGELRTGLSGAERAFQSAVFSYGVDPLEILLHSDTRQLALGSTFASLLTNAVPRPLWPSKPDTGGVHFTKVYTGDAWGGASNLTPTFLGEWVLNFDWVAGCILFAASYLALLLATLRARRRMQTQLAARADRAGAFAAVRYVCLLWAVVGLMVGEVTNVVLGLALTQLLPLWLLRKALLRRSRLSSSGAARPASSPT